MFLSEDYWNKRYTDNDFGWDAGDITTPLQTYFDQLSDKNLRILIPGAGNAYEAQYLFNKGFKNVFILDFAGVALENFSARCPGFPKQNLLKENFFKHDGKYDLIIEQTFFCAIDPKLRPAYSEKMNALLNPKGKLVGLLFNDILNSDKPPFGGNKEEYLAYFTPYFTIHTFEECYNSIKPRAGRELFIHLTKK